MATATNKTTTLVAPQRDYRMLATAAGAPALREMIAQRAYSLWQSHGCPVGPALKDWLQAEAEVKAEVQRAQRLQPAAR